MTQPDPDPQSGGYLDTIKAFIEGFGRLQAVLAFAGLFTALLLFFGWITGGLPDWTLLIAIFLVAVIAYLVFTFGNRYFDLLERREKGTGPTETPDSPPSVEPPADKTGDDNKPADTPGREQEAVSVAEWERRYLLHLMHLCLYPPSMALVDIKEAGFHAEKLALDHIFTSLDVPHAEHLRDMATADLAQLEQTERLQREPALSAIGRAANDRLVLLGAPGSGKSTLVNYLTLCLAGDRLAGDYDDEVDVTQDDLREHGWELGHKRLWPVRVILREYAARGLSKGQDVWQFIAADLSRPTIKLAGYVPHLKRRLENEGGILLLDGLDEVDKASELRKSLKDNIELFARDFEKVRIVVTSRPYAYGSGWELKAFQVTWLLPFSDEQIEAFVTQWYAVMGQKDGTLGPEKAEQYGKGLIQQVQQNRNLRELARHPLLLTMMVLIHRGREGGALPQRREELYRLSVILLLDHWRRSKSIPGQETKTLSEVLGVDTERLMEALAEVAFVAHRDQAEQEQTADIPGELLAGKLHKYRGKETAVSTDDIIEYVRDRAGLLEDHGRNDDDSDDVYRFPHRTFQEYLAGLHLLKQNFPYDLARLAKEDPGRWREALLLAAASQRKVPYTVWSLVTSLCQQPPAAGSDANDPDLWGAFLAGQVLAEAELTGPEAAQNEMERATRARVQAWHQAILQRGLLPPRDRALAGAALAALGDHRPGVLRCDEMPLCLVPPGSFWLESWEKGKRDDWYDGLDRPYWLAQHPVTVAQFREFVQESHFNPSFPRGSLDGPDNWPVAWVNWYDALAFCEWLETRWRQKGWLPDGYRVTLPSELEWEKAARGGRQILARPQIVTPEQLAAQAVGELPWQENPLPQRIYPWGNAPEQEEETDGDAIYRTNNGSAGIGERCAVGSFPAGQSPVGCLDMSGQVWEWTRSLHGKPFPPELTPEFETADSRNNNDIVLRGGSYYSDQNPCSARGRGAPDVFLGVSGVRVVVSPFLASGR